MAYKYFTKVLLDSGLVDLNSVFPDKQKMAQEQNNVAYDFASIVDYLRTSTNNFKITDQKYIDLDNAIRAIMDKWYNSINERNPFVDSDEDIVSDDTFVSGNTPRDAAEVKDGKISSRGVSKAAPTMVPEPDVIKAEEKINEQTVVVPEQGIEEMPAMTVETVPVAEIPVVEETVAEIEEAPAVKTEPTHEEILEAIETLQFLADDGDESAKEAIEALQLLLD